MKSRLFLMGIVFIISTLILAACDLDTLFIEETTPTVTPINENQSEAPLTETSGGITLPQDYSTMEFDTGDLPEITTLHVPREAESIGAAVEKLGEYGRVIVGAGSYWENIEIQRGTHIIIQAEDSERPHLFAAEAELPVVYIAPEATLSLIGLSVHGVRSGIVAGSVLTEGAAHAVTILYTHVTDAEYGIYGLAEQFSIEGSIIEHNDYGLVLAGSSSLVNTSIVENGFNVVLSGSDYPSCAMAGYHPSGNTVHIENVNIWWGQNGGLAICNVDSATIKDIYAYQNACFGVQINNTTHFEFIDSRVGETQLWQGGWGDGLVVTHSTGDVTDSQFAANRRANIVYWGDSKGIVDNNLIIYAVFAIDLEAKDGYFPYPDITENNVMYGNTENRVTFGNDLVPSPPPEIPSL